MALLAACTAVCGGGNAAAGSAGSAAAPAPAPGFTISLSAGSLTLSGGGQASVTLSAQALNGFVGAISVDTSGLPGGVTATPSSFDMYAGEYTASISFSDAGPAPPGTYTISFQAISGSVTQNATLTLNLLASASPPLTGRLGYTFTGAATEYAIYPNQHWMAYLESAGLLFIADPLGGQVSVVNPASETLITAIPVPGAWAVDSTPDESTLYVGTLYGDIYMISASSLAVTGHYDHAQIGPNGYSAIAALVLSDGNLGLLGVPNEPISYARVDGFPSFAVWNPGTNALAVYTTSYLNPIGLPAGGTVVCGTMLGILGFDRTPDRSSLMLSSADTDGTMCRLNASTGAYAYASGVASISGNFAQSADGTLLAAVRYGSSSTSGVAILNATNLDVLSTLSAGGVGLNTALSFSPDGSTVYVATPLFNTGAATAYNVASGALIGTIPGPDVPFYVSGLLSGPTMLPLGTTGLLAMPQQEGVGFFDTAMLQAGNGDLFSFYPGAVDGPVAGGTEMTLSVSPVPAAPVTGVYFGSTPAAFTVDGGSIVTGPPPGQPGPVNMTVTTSDGGAALSARSFSYGPWITSSLPNYSTADGGGQGFLYGFGVVPSSNSSGSVATVAIGDITAAVTASTSNAYGSPEVFPLNGLAYTIPSAPAATAPAITVSAADGTTASAGTMTYLPAVQNYPLPGAALIQGIYDPTRQVYYFTDANQVRVFSIGAGWLTSIPMPAPPGATSQRLWGLSLSPDGTKLAVADNANNVIYLVDPSSPSQVRTFPLPNASVPGSVTEPVAVAVTNAGTVFCMNDVMGGTGFENVNVLDTGTGAVTTEPSITEVDGASQLFQAQLSADGSTVYINENGGVSGLSAGSGAQVSYVQSQTVISNDSELAVAASAGTVVADGVIFDAGLAAHAGYSMSLQAAWNADYVNGVQIRNDGALVFQAGANFLDVFNGFSGQLVARVGLPFQFSTNYSALVADGADNILLAIPAGGAGISLLDLSAIPVPAPLP